MVPTRPTNIRTMRTTCPAGGSSAVMPVDRPTVAKAEMASNRTSLQVRNRVTLRRSSVAVPTTPTASRTTVRAWRWTSREMRRPKA